MTPIDELRYCFNLGLLVKDKKNALAKCGAPNELQGIAYDNPIVQGGTNNFDGSIVNRADFVLLLAGQERKLNALREKVMRKISNVENPYLEEILIARYVKCEEWVDISKLMNYSTSNIYKAHKKALNKYEKNYQNT